MQCTFSGLLPEPRWYEGGVFASRVFVGEHAGVTIYKKSPEKVAMAITAAKCQEVAALPHAVLTVTDFATLFGGIAESCFKVKKLPNGIKDLKTVKSGDLLEKEKRKDSHN
jgi:hypothetical protein